MAGSYPDSAAPVNGRARRRFACGPAFAPASHPSGFDRPRRPEAFHTATATTFFRPTDTTGRLSRATPPWSRLRSRLASCFVSIGIASAGDFDSQLQRTSPRRPALARRRWRSYPSCCCPASAAVSHHRVRSLSRRLRANRADARCRRKRVGGFPGRNFRDVRPSRQACA